MPISRHWSRRLNLMGVSDTSSVPNDMLLYLLQDAPSAQIHSEGEGDRAWEAVRWHALERVLPADVVDGVALADGDGQPRVHRFAP